MSVRAGRMDICSTSPSTAAMAVSSKRAWSVAARLTLAAGAIVDLGLAEPPVVESECDPAAVGREARLTDRKRDGKFQIFITNRLGAEIPDDGLHAPQGVVRVCAGEKKNEFIAPVTGYDVYSSETL